MEVIEREHYNNILKNSVLSSFELEDMIPLDIYHVNNWDRLIKNWDDDKRNEEPFIADFFFDSKDMIEFIKLLLKEIDISVCYFAPVYSGYKLLKPIDNMTESIYCQMKQFLNSIGLRSNTTKAIKLNKDELFEIIELWSVVGFSGLAEYSILLPENKLLITAYHHMNYLIYTNEKIDIKPIIKRYSTDSVILYEEKK